MDVQSKANILLNQIKEGISFKDSLLNRIDTIEIKSQAELENLLAWRDLNKDLVRDYHPALNEGIIIYSGTVKIHFRHIDHLIVAKMYSGNVFVFQIVIQPKADMMNNYRVVQEKFFVPFEDEAKKREAIQDCITTIASIMAYMIHYKEYVSEKNVVHNSPTSKKKGRSKKKKSSVKIGKKVYTVSVPEGIRTTKTTRQKHTESWSVKGHWRQYKSGKKVWIPSYVKGDKAKVEPKTYHL